MFSNFYIRTNKEETRMSDIKVIKANVTLNGRNKKRNTDSKRSRLFFLCRKSACILSETKKNGFYQYRETYLHPQCLVQVTRMHTRLCGNTSFITGQVMEGTYQHPGFTVNLSGNVPWQNGNNMEAFDRWQTN